jgi:hypothetical protein
MRRCVLAGAAVIGAGVLLSTASASASVIDLGTTRTPVSAPTCPAKLPPSQCTIILTRSTAIETLRDGVAYPGTAPKPGRIVAFTLGLSALSSNRTTRLNDIRFLDHQYGGTTQVAITVLRRSGPRRQFAWKVVAESPLFHVQPYLGEVVQFPLIQTLPIRRGDVIGLTTPTWAPVLSINQPTKKFAYRQSRKANCAHPPSTSQAQLKPGATARYLCNYPGTRVEYSATEITTPPIPTNYVHLGRRAATWR